MVRPRGYVLSRPGLEAVLLKKKLSMTEAAKLCDVPLKTLSALATGHRKASITVVRHLTEGLVVDASVLFPDYGRAARSAEAVAE